VADMDYPVAAINYPAKVWHLELVHRSNILRRTNFNRYWLFN